MDVVYSQSHSSLSIQERLKMTTHQSILTQYLSKVNIMTKFYKTVTDYPECIKASWRLCSNQSYFNIWKETLAILRNVNHILIRKKNQLLMYEKILKVGHQAKYAKQHPKGILAVWNSRKQPFDDSLQAITNIMESLTKITNENVSWWT